MTKGAAVAVAVLSTLHEDGMPIDRPDYVMGDPPFRYNDITIDNFLRVVERKLSLYKPPYVFAYDAAFRAKALKASVSGLIAKVQTRTKVAP